MKQSRNKSGCVPWNYPQADDEISVICDGPQTVKFESEMEKFNPEDCEITCDEDCVRTEFVISDISR